MLTGLAARASLWNRRRKLALFLNELRPGPETTIVDVGVGDTGFDTEPGVALSHNFFEALYPWPERITAVSDVPLPNFAREFPAIVCVTANGTDLPFADDAFDIAFSNAVVEHVGDRDAQRRFVGELCRVAPRVFMSTPNRRFPIEVHTLVPFVHWLPRNTRDRVFGALRRDAWDGVELLTRSELLSLFPPEATTRVIESRITITVVATRPRPVIPAVPNSK
jgi:SAM-dependent methyltransferase